MRKPIFVRPLSDAEREILKAALRSPDAFVLRRCQILLASAQGHTAYQIARTFGCHEQTVRNAIYEFNEEGLEVALCKGSRRPHTIHAAFDRERAAKLKEMLHRSPREFGKPSGLWTLEMAAEASLEEGLTQKQVSGETIRATLARMGVRFGSGSSTGSQAPILSTLEKKAARPADEPRGKPEWLGGRFRGRELVEPAGPARAAQLEW